MTSRHWYRIFFLYLERLAFPLDYSSTNQPSIPPTGKQFDNSQNDYYKTGLIEKKQQQWRQENGKFIQIIILAWSFCL